VARAGPLLQDRVAEDVCVEVDGPFGVIDGEGEMIECAEALSRIRGESGAGGESPSGEQLVTGVIRSPPRKGLVWETALRPEHVFSHPPKADPEVVGFDRSDDLCPMRVPI
jgi:hypothetical protein